MARDGILYTSTKRIRADLILLLVSLIWGSAFVAQRVAAQQMDVFLFNGSRFFLGALFLLPLVGRRMGELQRVDIPGIFLAGALLFGGATLQQMGIATTTAANAGFITGLYVVLIPLLLATGWRQRPPARIWFAASLAVGGMFLLSTGGRLALAPGDLLVFLGAILWALHVIVIGLLVKRIGVLQLAVGQYIVCGLLNLFLFALFQRPLEASSIGLAWWAVIYTGLFSIGIGYTLQSVGQKEAPPADAAILLSMEAVFAAVFGWALLDERLSAVQLAGCVLMVTGMILSQVAIILKAEEDTGLVDV
jgi:drug/metabolite transporter (DMT)-like permease